MQFKEATKSKTLEELLSSPNTYIRLGKQKKIMDMPGGPLYEVPSYFYITPERDIVRIEQNLEATFVAHITEDMSIEFRSSWDENPNYNDFLKLGIKSIRIKGNLIWVEYKGKEDDGNYTNSTTTGTNFEKLCYWMHSRKVMGSKWQLIDYLTEMVPAFSDDDKFKDATPKPHRRLRPVFAVTNR